MSENPKEDWRKQAVIELYRLLGQIEKQLEAMEERGASIEARGVHLLQQFPLIHDGVWNAYVSANLSIAPLKRGRRPNEERSSWREVWLAVVKKILDPPFFSGVEANKMGPVRFLFNDVLVSPLPSEGGSASFAATADRIRACDNSAGRSRSAERLAAKYLWERYPASHSQQWLANLCQEKCEADPLVLKLDAPGRIRERRLEQTRRRSAFYRLRRPKKRKSHER